LTLRADLWRYELLAVGMTCLKRIGLRIKALWAAADAGMSTAEYAVGTIAAVAFAAVLYKVVRSPEIQAALTAILRSALNVSL
jgi:hypothetical protein